MKLPKSSNIVSNGIKINDISINSYSYNSDSNTLTIPLSENEAKISVVIKMNAAYPISSYAQMNFKKNGTTMNEVIGTISSSLDMISITAGSKTDNETITVQGIAPSESIVSLYIDNEYIGTTTASKIGVYTTNIVLKDPIELEDYIITAKAESDSGSISAETRVTYRTDTDSVSKELEEFKLYYSYAHSGNIKEVDLLALNGSRPTLINYIHEPMTFIVKPKGDGTNYSSINVVSTKNGQEKKIECKWDDSKKVYVGRGYFEPSNISYVPGEISVEYITNKTENVFNNSVDYQSNVYQSSFKESGLSEKVTTEIVAQTDNKLTYKIHLNNEEHTVIEQTIESEDLSNPATDIFAKDNDFVSIVDSAGVTYYTKVIFAGEDDSSRAKNILKIIKKNDTKLVSFFFDSDVSKSYKYLKDTIYKPAADYVGILKDIYDGAKLDSDISETIWNLERDSTLSIEERNRQLALANGAYLLNGISTIGSVALTAFGMLGAVTAPWLIAGGIIFGALGYIAKEYNDGLNGDVAFEDFINSFSWLNWLMDPSGFVCEAVAGNRIEGVKTTLYCIPYDDSDNFWDYPDTSKAIIWNAAEFDQSNPLYTDSEGYYAWDVPEGWWQVKYEKEGYETTYSEWLPVPPPQTQVNIAMKTTQAPNINNIVAYEDYVVLSFDQYMNLDTLNASSIKLSNNGVIVNCEIEPLNEECSFDDPSVKYASEFKVVPTSDVKLTNDSLLIIRNVKNYAGIEIKESHTSSLDVQYKIEKIDAPDNLTIVYGNTETIELVVEPKEAVSGKNVYVELSNNFVALVSAVAFDNNGKSIITIESLLPGSVNVKLSIEGTTFEATIPITVTLDGYQENEPHKHSYTKITTKATCLTSGYTSYTCECGDSYISDEVGALGHNMSAYEMVLEPSCVEDGLEQSKCSRCDYTELRPVNPTENHLDGDGDGCCDSCDMNLDSSVNCDCMCHETGIMNIIWKILKFLYKLFKINPICECGVAHY